jgi:putative aldouronate transport system permease protein
MEKVNNYPIVVRKKKRKIKAFDVINYSFLTLFAIVCILPCIYVLLTSFADKSDQMRTLSNGGFFIIPLGFNFENYKVTLFQDKIFRAFGISLLVTAASVAYSLVLTTFGAYAFTKRDCPGIKLFFYIIVFTMFFGGGLVPFYLTVEDLIGVNNLWSLILPFGINTFNMIILRNFFNQVPDSVIDSCRLDGASEFRILFQFVVPLSKAGVATIILYYLVGKWDDWYWPAIFLADSPDLAPLALKIRQGLNDLRGEGQGGGWDPTRTFPDGTNSAMIVIGLIPIMIVYPFLQRYFSKGVMIGAVKG